jgi:hypothetical protein
LVMFSSKTHTLTWNQDGSFQVVELEERLIVKSKFDSNGAEHKVSVVEDIIPGFTKDKYPLFKAQADMDGGYHVDLDAGFQRWHGWKSGKAVGIALRRCGFDKAEVKTILDKARKHKAPSMSRCW